MYPVMLAVEGRRCLVVGGGGIALRKVDGLLAQGAQVTVVAPEAILQVEELARERLITFERRPYRDGEATDYALVIAATDDRAVNRRVFEDADGAGIWVNVADDPPLCTFHLPARIDRGTMQLAVASAGEAPFAVRRLRQLFERRFGAEWAEWMDAAGRFRRAVRRLHLPRAEQEARYDAFFNGTVDKDRLTARVPTQTEEAVFLATGPAESHSQPWNRAAVPAAEYGLVSLIGGGPGDAGLLTLRGRQRLLAADTVVYDRLAATALPCDLRADIELHCVGKQAGNHPVPQEEINALLVRLAREGKRVARLKGGDPFVFGRGGEEAEALAEAGIPFEVVPAVTAGIAVPAYAGIPVTHRQEAVRATVVTAHEAIKSSGLQVRWDLLAADPHSTLLGYMGVTAFPAVAEKLITAGMDPDTPAAMIESGTTSGQRVVRATLATLAEAVERAGLEPPGLFVIGPTVRHAETLDWFGRRPLCGERLVIIAPAGAAGEELEIAGAELVEVPLPVTPAARIVMGASPITGCVLRNAHEVEVLDEERLGRGWSAQVVAWCLTPDAADRARERGWSRVEEIVDAPALVAAITVDRGRRAGTDGVAPASSHPAT